MSEIDTPKLLTDDMDTRDTKFSMYVGGNGDYYLELQETKRGKIIKIDTRIAMSGGNATTAVKTAIANLYKALQGEQVSSVLQANDNIPLVINSGLPEWLDVGTRAEAKFIWDSHKTNEDNLRVKAVKMIQERAAEAGYTINLRKSMELFQSHCL